LLASCFFLYDIGHDVLRGNESALHVALEACVFLAICVALWFEVRRVAALRRALQAAESQSARLSGDLLAVMQGEFARWHLSPSECEIALLTIKGLSMREIAEARGVKEKTVRQQATQIYAKSGYGGRHELVAHFIEDLMGAGGVVQANAKDAL